MKAKAKPKGAPVRREEALSREQIVSAAIQLLDDEGEDGLTFRALATLLATGAGALYWHVKSKDELLVAATDVVIERTLADAGCSDSAQAAIHEIALGVFQTVDEHPWVGAQLALNPPPTAMLKIFERLGRQVQALGAEPALQFTATTVLGSYIVSESRQNAANGRIQQPHPDRAEFLAQAAARWEKLDPSEFPFTRNAAAQLRDHDDRAEFLAGVDLILAGIAARST